MALANMGFKDQNWSHFGEGEQTVKGEKREEEEEEEEEDGGAKIKQKGMETHLDYEFYEIWHGSLVLYYYYLAQT